MSIMAFTTLLTIQIVAHVNNSVPDWWYFAPFSVTAANSPQKLIYAIGMSVVVILFSLTMYIVFAIYLDRADQGQKCLLKFCIGLVVLASIGCVVQAWVSLQPDIIDYMQQKTHTYTTESFVHTLAAGVFFGFATLVLTIFALLIGYSSENGLQRVTRKSSRVMKYIFTILMILSVVAGFVLHPAVAESYTHDTYNSGGALQWTCVFSLILYILTFSMDIHDHRMLYMNEYNLGKRPDPETYSELPRTPTSGKYRTHITRNANVLDSDDEGDERTGLVTHIER
jgi:hypothetical protein